MSKSSAGGKKASRFPHAVKPESPAPVDKNQTVIADIVGLGHEGEGVGRVDGFTLFIPGALPGEKVRALVVKVKKQFGYAKLLEVLEPSPDRMEAPCAIYKQCGGCQLQHMQYPAQLRQKRQLVIDSLERIGKLRVKKQVEAAEASGAAEDGAGMSEDGAKAKGTDAGLADAAATAGHESDGIVVHPTIGMDEPWRYRNKAQVPIGAVEGGLVGGFYAQGSHRIIEMDECLIQHERNDAVVNQVKALARELGIRAYNEETHRGLLRHVVVKFGFRTGDLMLVLVTNGENIPHQDELINLLRQEFVGLKSICQSINTERTNVIFGERTKMLWGEEFIYDYIGDIRFAISARSFYQVNPVQTEILYGKALEYAGLQGKETVIDAYCGIGTISLFLAQHAEHVYGVEIVPEAIVDANRNAALNGIANVTFGVGKAEEVIPAWRKEGIVPDVIVVDPPRKGCDPALLETMAAMQPRRIVYVSCNPATLARDLQVLEDRGYRTVEVQPVDMFPHTVHVECTVRLERKDCEKPN